MTYYPLGSSAFTLVFGTEIKHSTTQEVWAAADFIDKNPFPGYIENVPAYTTLTVFFDPSEIKKSPDLIAKTLIKKIHSNAKMISEVPSREIIVPVCFDDDFAPDLPKILEAKNMSKNTFLSTLLSSTYSVSMTGFLPGFPYMSGLPKTLSFPRKSTPQARVEGGSLAIGGDQLGVYPITSPGGWNIIGRTPLAIFDPSRSRPFLLQASDQVNVIAISREEYDIQKSPDFLQTRLPATQFPSLTVMRCLGQHTIQHIPRLGFRKYGIPQAGPIDTESCAMANLIAGNPLDHPVIELSMGQLSLEFENNLQCAVVGNAKVLVNQVPISTSQSFSVKVNDRIDISWIGGSPFAYLAIRGNWQVTPVLGSCSTSPACSLGYILQKGDTLKIDAVQVSHTAEIYINKQPIKKHIIRFTKGPEYVFLTEESKKFMVEAKYRINSARNRMAFPIAGQPLLFSEKLELISSAVVQGTIQCTPDGTLFILSRDAQTIGGYPRIGFVLEEDLNFLARIPHGESFQLELTEG